MQPQQKLKDENDLQEGHFMINVSNSEEGNFEERRSGKKLKAACKTGFLKKKSDLDFKYPQKRRSHRTAGASFEPD